MKKYIILTLIFCFISCQNQKDDIEIHREYFELQMKNYTNILKIDIEKIVLTKQDRGYPMLVESECKVTQSRSHVHRQSDVTGRNYYSPLPIQFSPY